MDFTGVEQYVHHCITTGSIQWFPLNQSLTLNAAKADDSDSDDDILNKVEAVKQMCVKCDSEIQGMRKELKDVNRSFQAHTRQLTDILMNIQDSLRERPFNEQIQIRRAPNVSDTRAVPATT